MRLCFVWSRPAVSTKSRSAFRASATAHASWTTAAGSAPALCFTSGMFRRVGPDLELLDRRGAERVGRGEHDRLPGGGRARGELGGRRRLARAVDADHENHARRLPAAPTARGLAALDGQPPGDLRLQDAPHDVLLGRVPAPGLRPHGGDELRGRRRPDVRREETFLERVERRGIRLERGLHGAPHLREELRVRHEEPALQAGEDGRTDRARRSAIGPRD